MKTRFLIIIALIQYIFISISYGTELPTYNLDGKLNASGQELTLMIRIEEKGKMLISKLYVPEQLLFAHQASSTEIIEDTLIIEFKSIGAMYKGFINYPDYKLEGIYTQGGVYFELIMDFIPDSEAIMFKRPQEPKPPFTYYEQEHLIRDNRVNIALSGMLSLPNKIGKFPLVILITGSGPQDRNQTIAGHKPFLVISDYLTRNGIAVFRYDERGVGKSTGKFNDATSADFTYDVLNIVKYFRVHENIDNNRIGLIGHSEGGLVAMKAAAENKKDIAFIISLAGPAVNSVDLLQKQMYELLRVAGKSEEMIEKSIDYQGKAFDIALKSKDMSDLRQRLTELNEEFSEGLSDEEISELGLNQHGLNSSVMQLSSPWIKYFLKQNPEDYLIKLKCPVLAIFGDKDLQVNAEQNHKTMEEILSSKRNQKYEVYTMQGLNHLMQTAQTGNIEEYLLIEESFSVGVMEMMKNFIKIGTAKVEEDN
jgi:uncharacterized protein